MQSVRTLGVAALALAVISGLMWVVWFGWDEVPPDAWRVVGCGLSICVGAVASFVLTRRGVVVLAVAAAVGLAVPWGLHAASTDDSGLWVVGLVLLLAGSFLGLVVVLTVTSWVLRRQS